jgi:hypothetical protein
VHQRHTPIADSYRDLDADHNDQPRTAALRGTFCHETPNRPVYDKTRVKGLPAMTEIDNYSRRFFADFIAVRLRATRIETDKLWRATEDRHLAASPSPDDGSVSMPTNQVRPSNPSRRFYR